MALAVSRHLHEDPTGTRNRAVLLSGAIVNIVKMVVTEVAMQALDNYFDKPQRFAVFDAEDLQPKVILQGLRDDFIVGAMHNPLSRIYAEGAMRAEREMIARGADSELMLVTRHAYYADVGEYRSILTQASNLVRTLTGNVLYRVYSAMSVRIGQGKSRREVANIVKHIAGGRLTRFQARRIAHTEVVRAYNVGARKRFETYGVRHWQWVTSRETEGLTATADGKVCEVCLPLHTKIKEIGVPFSFGGAFNQPIVQPPDPHPFCRCMCVPVFDEEMRQTDERRSVFRRALGRIAGTLRRLVKFESDRIYPPQRFEVLGG